MARPLDTRLDRVEGRRMGIAAERGSAMIRRRRRWRAEAAIGAVIRDALARAGVDPAGATRLALADKASALLAALPDTPQLRCANGNGASAADAHDGVQAEAFALKIEALAQRFAGRPPPDFANASFAELFAWSLARPAAD